MPELPEVEVVRAGLEPAMSGALVLGVEVFDTRALTRHTTALGDFEELLTGARIAAVARRGKFLWMPLAATDTALLAHLGMSGQLLLREPGTPPASDGPVRIRLVIEHPTHGELAVHFVDQRTFGSLAIDRLVPAADGLPAGRGTPDAMLPGQVSHIARDPLDPAFHDDRFLTALARKHTAVKRALLDQTLISGVGNIYADESLWAARIHPELPAASLGVRRARRLLAELRGVLTRALAEGGTSFDAQYVNVNGASGYFARSLNVYGRQGLPCKRCGTLIARERFMNRSSHVCPACQRKR